MVILRQLLVAITALTLSGVVHSFLQPYPYAYIAATISPSIRYGSGSSALALHLSKTFEPVAPSQVEVLDDVNKVSVVLCDEVIEASKKAIAERGAFSLAIPGGSILKMLTKMPSVDAVDWSKVTIAYVNHKCVPMDHKDATHHKAVLMFLAPWIERGCNVITLSGSDDAEVEAAKYTAALEDLPENVLPKVNGFPIFDLALVGVGDDGHCGSLYPNRDEVLETQKWVLPVTMKTPPSITMTLPLLQLAKRCVIATAGVSEKYPKGKGEAMKRAIEGSETLQSFPAAGLREVAVWLLDEGAASELSSSYR